MIKLATDSSVVTAWGTPGSIRKITSYSNALVVGVSARQPQYAPHWRESETIPTLSLKGRYIGIIGGERGAM